MTKAQEGVAACDRASVELRSAISSVELAASCFRDYIATLEVWHFLAPASSDFHERATPAL